MPEYYNFDHLPKKLFEPLSKSDFQTLPKESIDPLPKELLAAAKAGEICELVDDLDVMKELYCVLAYALAQKPDLLMEYLKTFLGLVKRKKLNK